MSKKFSGKIYYIRHKKTGRLHSLKLESLPKPYKTKGHAKNGIHAMTGCDVLGMEGDEYKALFANMTPMPVWSKDTIDQWPDYAAYSNESRRVQGIRYRERDAILKPLLAEVEKNPVWEIVMYDLTQIEPVVVG